MTLPPFISAHVRVGKMKGLVCFVGERVPITVRVKNDSDSPFPKNEGESLVIEIWDEMIKYYPGRRGHTTLNIKFSEPFRLGPKETREFKFYFELPELTQYKICAGLNLIKIIRTTGDPKWNEWKSGRLFDRLGRSVTLEFKKGTIDVEVLGIKRVSINKKCTSMHDLVLIWASIIAAFASAVLLVLEVISRL